jgi:sortase A
MWLVERLAWSAGVGALGVWIVVAADGRFGTAQELQKFATLRAAGNLPGDPPDQRLWSAERVKAWNEARRHESPVPLGVLSIPRLHLVVPVLPGTDDWTLNRAVGTIDGTAPPGSDGNSGIAGHRDSFFRVLKDVVSGDVITLETQRGVESYRVERVWIVGPEDVSVLDPTPTRSMTLVTCYPFYFVGPAPQRYIVRAVLSQSR